MNNSENKLTLTDIFLNNYPSALIEEKGTKGNAVVYVNGQTAFSKADVNNASNWLIMMEAAYKRSL